MAWYQKPRTESSCLPCGEFDARIIKIERKTSKKGNLMAELALEIEYQGRKRLVRDWIVQGFEKSMAKVPAIAAGLGMTADLQDGTFHLGEQVGKLIRVMVGRRNDPKYGWSNTVEAYMTSGVGMGHDVAPTEPEPAYYPDAHGSDMPF